jgi:hypothetical protein
MTDQIQPANAIPIKAPSAYVSKYRSDPEYRKRHLKYMSQKIRCPCGAMMVRNNATMHRATKQHKFTMSLFESLTPAEIEKYLTAKHEMV